MPHVEPIAREDLAHLEEGFALVEAAMGFVPSSLRTMAHVPGLAEGFQGLAGVVLANPMIDGELKHMVSHVASRAAGCRYCQAHTGATAVNQGADPAKIAAIWEFETSALFTDAERAALRLAFHSGANAATADDFTACRAHFNEPEIVSIVAVCALFGYLNRWNDTMATALEDEPAAFAETTLAPLGWHADKHA
ncbi:MAG: fusion protein [Acidimicrobiales bacterium]|nr:MAG: fusion protein [Acidimicrobiales bacterium]